MKTIIVINGKGGSGKDELINHWPEKYMNVSSIDPIKTVAKSLGWDGKKDKKGRLFLSNLKKLADENNSFSTNYLMEQVKKFYSQDEANTMFVHIREPENIELFRARVKALPMDEEVKVLTVLVMAEWSDKEFGNPSDDNVTNYSYDIVFKNIAGIEESARMFYEGIIQKTKKNSSKKIRFSEFEYQFLLSILEKEEKICRIFDDLNCLDNERLVPVVQSIAKKIHEIQYS